MLLPVLNIELPTNEWEIEKMEFIDCLADDGGYSVLIKHVPTGETFEAIDEGWGGELTYSFLPEQTELKEKWEGFASECAPQIREFDKLRGYDFDDEYDESDFSDAVINLIFEEMNEQDQFSEQKDTVVREFGAEYGVFKTFKAKPHALRNVGKVKGDYWDKYSKQWVAI